MIKKIAIIGGGGHAKDIISLIHKLKIYEIIGYIDVQNRGEVLGYKYLGTDQQFLNNYSCSENDNVVLGIGQTVPVTTKIEIIREFEEYKFSFPSLVSPFTIINEDVIIGKGSIILDHVVVNPSVFIGDFVSIYPNCVVEHDCKIGNHVYLAPSVSICGGTIIEEGCNIGNGVSISDLIKISAFNKIDAGRSITSDI